MKSGFRILVERHLNYEIIDEINKNTNLGKRLSEILTIIPDGVDIPEYCEKTWNTYSKNKI